MSAKRSQDEFERKVKKIVTELTPRWLFIYLFVGIIATNALMHLNFVQIQTRDRPKCEERTHFILIVLTWPFVVSWFAMFEFIIPLCIYMIDTCMFVSQK